MDDFFSESKPDLINKKTLYNFEKMLKKPKVTVEETSWGNTLSYIYDEYIKPNVFFIIVIVLLALFLLYRYMTKSENIIEPDHFNGDIFERPVLNPNIPIKEQNPQVNYLADEIPFRYEDMYITHNDIDPPIEYPFKYPDIPPKIQDNGRVYSGLHNIYNDGHLFIDSDYDRATNNALDYMTKQNRRNLDLLAEIIFDSSNPSKIDSSPGMEYAPYTRFIN